MNTDHIYQKAFKKGYRGDDIVGAWLADNCSILGVFMAILVIAAYKHGHPVLWVLPAAIVPFWISACRKAARWAQGPIILSMLLSVTMGWI